MFNPQSFTSYSFPIKFNFAHTTLTYSDILIVRVHIFFLYLLSPPPLQLIAVLTCHVWEISFFFFIWRGIMGEGSLSDLPYCCWNELHIHVEPAWSFRLYPHLCKLLVVSVQLFAIEWKSIPASINFLYPLVPLVRLIGVCWSLSQL